MEIKENLSYTNDHEWIKIDGNTALVGITDFAQSELGDIVFIEVETIGEDLNKNEVFGTVEAVKLFQIFLFRFLEKFWSSILLLRIILS